MDDNEIQRLREEERTYWWHISRRAILESVLSRFSTQFLCHPDPTLRHPELDSGSPAQIPGQARNDGKEINQNVSEQPKILDVGCGTGENLYSNYCSNIVRTNNDDSSWQMPRTVKILDVGCGTGVNFSWLNQFGEVVGADNSELAIELASQKGTATLGRAEDLPFEDCVFDLVTAFDILEHVTDEERVLGEWKRALRFKGLLFVSVPAYQWLFGPHDRALSHLRRYNLPQLKRILQNNGFHIIFASYFFCLTFPAFLAQRWLAKFSQNDTSQYVGVAPWLNNFLIGLGKLEAAWLKIGTLPLGSSIVVLARKNNSNFSTPPLTPPPRGGEFSWKYFSLISPPARGGDRGGGSKGRLRGDDEAKLPFRKRIEGLHYFKISQQLIRFAIVGVGNTAIDIGLLNLFLFWHWPVIWANTIAFIFAAVNGFFLNKYWTFGDTTGKWQVQLPFYITVAAVGLGLSDALVYVFSLIFHWDVNVVKILSIGIIGLWNFLAPKFLIFKK